MLQIPSFFSIALLGAIFVWLGFLTYQSQKLRSHYNRLGRGVSKGNLGTILERALLETDIAKKDIDKLMMRCDNIEKEALSHVQKVGLVRFNPFANTGGDQSFIIALLNGRDEGILLSSLHGRTGTRWYAKKVKNGKGIELELSKEEQEAVKKAIYI